MCGLRIEIMLTAQRQAKGECSKGVVKGWRGRLQRGVLQKSAADIRTADQDQNPDRKTTDLELVTPYAIFSRSVAVC